jgi:hypothetical protein
MAYPSEYRLLIESARDYRYESERHLQRLRMSPLTLVRTLFSNRQEESQDVKAFILHFIKL